MDDFSYAMRYSAEELFKIYCLLDPYFDGIRRSIRDHIYWTERTLKWVIEVRDSPPDGDSRLHLHRFEKTQKRWDNVRCLPRPRVAPSEKREYSVRAHIEVKTGAIKPFSGIWGQNRKCNLIWPKATYRSESEGSMEGICIKGIEFSKGSGVSDLGKILANSR
jgi:hypothetical protein